jgi:hypothetical protein
LLECGQASTRQTDARRSKTILWGSEGYEITGTATGPNDSDASLSFPTSGMYIISLKDSTKTLAGTTAPVPANVTYTWTTSLGGNTGASVLLKRQ